jgi:hypothetical protein
LKQDENNSQRKALDRHLDSDKKIIDEFSVIIVQYFLDNLMTMTKEEKDLAIYKGLKGQ